MLRFPNPPNPQCPVTLVSSEITNQAGNYLTLLCLAVKAVLSRLKIAVSYLQLRLVLGKNDFFSHMLTTSSNEKIK